uniref:Nudix hydrolase domain-containing protein n=1 Tax=Melanopsichium pennsylvanicum 4 TaxID=1398559 RepID=A0A077R4S5_9BASI|nr:conserved hypothetical protein [Melanopsichium pennsylvanicum 4]
MYTHTLLFATHVHFPSVSGSYNEPRQILTNLLLGKKLRGFGKGSINGIGGKILSDETARESIIRETWEEVGFRLQAQQVTFVGRVRISVDQGEKVHIAVYTARLTNQQRKLVSNSDEIQVIWHSLLLEDRTLQPDLFDAVNLEGSMRPEHKVYLSLLLRHQSERDTGGLVKGMLLDVDIKFHSELKKETLGGEERPENHRELRRWEM